MNSDKWGIFFQEISYRHSDNWLEELQQLCASFGVALVYTPSIAKAPIYGATRWIKNNSIPIIQLTDREKDCHAFWFTFYHELGHILYHGKKDIFIEGIDSIQPDKEKEDEADAFAARMVVSSNYSVIFLAFTLFFVPFVGKHKKDANLILGWFASYVILVIWITIIWWGKALRKP